ncbi:MAG: transketolase [Deltaproteobacteria bacterium]|nr:transketolase [Deltaproteobacteria bacterium]
MIQPKVNDPLLLQEISAEIRRSVITTLSQAGSGRLGASLGLADLFTCLYFSVLAHDPADPLWPGRDRLILSIGHAAPVLYTTLARVGYFPEQELATLRKLGSRLQGHPGREHGLPGLELSAGSLGQGLSVSVGRALAAKMDDQSWRVFCILGDGELQEGSVWEAAMAAAHLKLDNLIAIVDRNGVQIDGKTEDVMALEPLKEKWRAFGWEVVECDGNNHQDILTSIHLVQQVPHKPGVILAYTKMGKGVGSIEGDYRWHGKAPSKQEASRFLRELDKEVS